MNNEKNNIKNSRDICIENAESLLKMAEENLNKGYDHICFHLALVALEEIGKAILILIGASLIAGQKEDEDFSITIDDHIKKIFWALWGDLLREKEFSKDEIEQVKTYLLHCIIKD